jgi:hypothetical protein
MLSEALKDALLVISEMHAKAVARERDRIVTPPPQNDFVCVRSRDR